MKTTMMVIAAIALVACKQGSSAPSAKAGTERGDCRAGGNCDPGLECRSNLCVRPPPADCAKVAEALGFLMLDNYTPREQREPELKKWEEACVREQLSKAEGACIETAADDSELAKCPRPLVPELVGDPEGCGRVGKRARELIEQGVGGDLGPIINVAEEVPDAVKQLCIEGRWSAEAKHCLLSVASFEDGERCVNLLDRAQQKAVERALRTLVLEGKSAPPRDPNDPWR